MSHIVGARGQIVIAKEIRHRLGIKPGWLALQRIAEDHVEVYFVPPEHSRSLKGSLSQYVSERPSADEEWQESKQRAWQQAADRRAG